jgi:hypothetical protein
VAKRLDAVEQSARRLDEITAQIAKIETALAALRASEADPAILSRVVALDTAVNSLLGRLGDLEKHIEVAASRLVAGGAIDPAMRVAFLAAALRSAVDSGDPIAAELAALRPYTSDTALLASLEAFAMSGVPSSRDLARELSALLPTLIAAAKPPQGDGGVLDRIQSTAGHLVRVRRVGEAPGDDAAAVLARIEAKAARGDISGTLAEFAKLPPAVRAPAEAWIQKAKQRSAAIDAAERLAAATLAALKPAP